MNHLLIIIVILLLIIFALLAKVYFLRKSAQEITEAFRDRLTADTNTLIDISARDPYMRKLAAEINIQLRLLRKERHRYQNGDRELKEAVTNISHDLRTPLTAICGYLELLERTEKTLEQERYLMFISQRAEAMKELTQELLRYSVAVSGGEELRLEPVDLNAALEDAVASFYGVLVDREIAPQERLQHLAAGAAGTTAPQGAGYGEIIVRAAGIVTAALFLTFISPINWELCINPNHMEPHLKKSLVHWDWECFLLGHTCSCRPKLPHYRAFPTLAERVCSVPGL